MTKKVVAATGVLCGVAFLLSGQRPPRSPARRAASAAPQGMLRDAALEQSVRGALSASPLRFEENLGQTDSRVKFAARGSNFMLYLTPQEAALSIHTPQVREKRPPQLDPEGATWAEALSASSVVRVQFAGGNPAAKLSGLDAQPGAINYIKGNDPNGWRRNVPHFGRVRYEGIYPGVDAVFYGDRRQMEYDFVVAPGADPSAIRMRVEGAASVELTEDGGLEARTPAGVVSLLPPTLYQQRDGAKLEIPGRYVWRAPGEIGFEVAAYDHSETLVIDPATNVKTKGWQNSQRRPHKNIIVPNVANPPSGGSVTLSTQLGGSIDDGIEAIAIGASTNTPFGHVHVYVAGFTDSYDFPPPPTPAPNGQLQANFGGTYYLGCQAPQSPCGDAFVAEFDVSANTPLTTAPVLLNTTYLGGSNDEVAWGLALDFADNAYLIGQTDSLDFPTTANAAQTPNGGTFDDGGDPVPNSGCGTPAQPRACHHVFFSVLSNDLSTLNYSTYLAGSDDDEGYAVAVDNSGLAYLTGVAGEYFLPNFCACGSFQDFYNGGGDAFFIVLDPTPAGNGVEYATYFGGFETDAGLTIALDPNGNAFIGGVTFSTRDDTFVFPCPDCAPNITENALQYNSIDTASCGPGGLFTCGDGFVVEFTYPGYVSYGTFLGGSGADQVNAILVNQFEGIDVIAVTGQSQLGPGGSDFVPVQLCANAGSESCNPYQSFNQGGYDAFLVVFSPSFEIYATYLGGSNDDIGLGIASDSLGDIYISGSTASGPNADPGFPLSNPLQAQTNAAYYAPTSFVSVFDITGNLVFSTYYGGNSDFYGNPPTDVGTAIALDSAGRIYLAGRSTSFTNPNNSTSIYGAQTLCLINPVPGANADQNQFGNGYNDNKGFLAIINPITSASPAGSGAAACFSPSLTLPQPLVLSFPPTLQGMTSGTQQFQTIYDQGSTALTNTITFTGANPTDFPETDNCATVAGGGASCQITISFAPKTGMAESATMVITNNSDGSPFMISLTGMGLPPATATLLPSPLTFPGTTQLGSSSASQTVTLTNTSAASPLDISSVALGGTNMGDFSIINTCPSTLAAGTPCSIFVIFTPTATGARTATLTVMDDGTTNPQITINATAVAPPPQVSLPPLSLTFAPQGQGTTSTAQTVTITNSAPANAASLVVTQPLTFTGGNAGDFAATGCTTPVPPNGGQCMINVTFTPTGTGARSSTLQIADNAPNTPQTVGVTGTGLAPPTATPSGTVTFAPQVTMTTSAPMSVTLTNSGGSPLGITSIGINPASTNPGDFAVFSNGCGTSLGAGAACVVEVTFTPAAIGARTAMLEFIDNAGNSPQNVTLNGTGATGPSAALTPPTLTFATPQQIMTTSASQPATLTNGGGAALSITSIAATGDFAVLSSTCGTSLAANSACPINITFTPTASGTRNGTLTVMDALGSQVINLTGTAVTPPTAILAPVTSLANPLVFGLQAVGVTSAAMPVTVTNNGGSQLNFTTIAPSGDFGVTGCAAPVAANGGFCTLSITFTPSGVGTRNGSIVIVDNAATSPQTIYLTGTGSSNVPGFNLSAPLFFGAVLTNSTSPAQTVTITNSGGAPLMITSAAASGDFAVSANTCTTVQIGQNCMISVTFTPTATGNRVGVLTIMDNAPGNPHLVQLSGIGATITMAPSPGATSSLTVLPGDTANYPITVTGTAGLVVTLGLSCASTAPYTLCSISPSSITLGGPTPPSFTVTLRTNCVTSMLPWRPSGPPPILPAPFAALWVGTVALYALLRRYAPQSRLVTRAAPVLLLLLLVMTWAGCVNNLPPAIPGAPTTPAGTYPVTVTASNGVNVTNQLNLTIRVI